MTVSSDVLETFQDLLILFETMNNSVMHFMKSSIILWILFWPTIDYKIHWIYEFEKNLDSSWRPLFEESSFKRRMPVRKNKLLGPCEILSHGQKRKKGGKINKWEIHGRKKIQFHLSQKSNFWTKMVLLHHCVRSMLV